MASDNRNGSNKILSNDDMEDEKSVKCSTGNRTRYVVLVLATLCLSSVLSNILTFNFTIICMTSSTEGISAGNLSSAAVISAATVATLKSKPQNDTEMLLAMNLTEEGERSNSSKVFDEGSPAEFNYSASTKSLLFAAVAIGALLVALPMPLLLTHLSTRYVFTIVGLISAVSTAAVPTAARMGVPYLLVARVFQGVGLAACLPIIGSVTAHWATLKQSGVFIALLSSFLQVAPIVTMPVAGELCTSELGWPAVYYFHAMAAVVCFTVFFLYFRDFPKKHPCVSSEEVSKIENGKYIHRSKKIPYMAIIKTPAVWAIWVAAIGNFFGTQLVLQFTPTYLNKVLKYPVANTGFASALPSFIMFFIKLGAGLTSDKVTCLPENLKVRVYNTLAVGGQGFFFIALAFVPATEMTIGLITLICATSILGFNSGGFFKSTQLLARHHSHFVMAHISFINCACMLLVPIVVDVLAPNDAELEWRNVFLFHAAVMITANAFFCLFASGKPAVWALDRSKIPTSSANNRQPAGHKVYTVSPQPGTLGAVKVL